MLPAFVAPPSSAASARAERLGTTEGRRSPSSDRGASVGNGRTTRIQCVGGCGMGDDGAQPHGLLGPRRRRMREGLAASSGKSRYGGNAAVAAAQT